MNSILKKQKNGHYRKLIVIIKWLIKYIKVVQCFIVNYVAENLYKKLLKNIEAIVKKIRLKISK